MEKFLYNDGVQYYSVQGAMEALNRKRWTVINYITVRKILEAKKFGLSNEWHITMDSVERVKNQVRTNK